MRALLLAIAFTVPSLGPAAAAEAGAPPARAARPAPASRARTVLVEPVRGDRGTEASRAALREAIARHLRRQGFHVVDAGKAAAYRLRPTVLALEPGAAGAVEVKASLVAVDRKGRVAAMVEGGARATGAAPGRAASVVEAQAIEAAARSIAEDLARRLLEAR